LKRTKPKPEEPYSRFVTLIGYDLRGETGKDLTEAQRSFLSRMRSHIWHELRFRHQCVLFQGSLWWVRDEAHRDSVLKAVEQWKKAFEDNGFPGADIMALDMKMTEKGVQALLVCELQDLMDGLGRLQQSLEKLRADGRRGKSEASDVSAKFEVFQEVARKDFGRKHRDRPQLEHQLQIVQDLLREVRG